VADGRARISWLHVSDLHVTKEKVGSKTARRPGSELWAEVQRGFFADLDAQLDATGLRPDLLLITGDLVYSGGAKQYEDFDAELLRPLQAHLRARGCEAVLVAVPGNHDVQRPSRADKRGYRCLREYDTRDDLDEDLEELRAELWQERDASFLTPLFASYTAWTERTMLPALAERTLPSGLRIEGLHRSHLPGDLSVVVARDDLRLLLVGLNSSWIQFDGGDFKGKLHVPLEQLHAALAHDEHAALRRFDDVDAALLLMHHPRDWLSPAAARTFDGFVYPARDERFTAFLFGHMHEARSEMSAGNGSAMRYFYQSPSLFGLEHYGETEQRLDVGYTLGALYEDEEIRLWVRRMGNSGQFGADPELRCEADGALVLRPARAQPTKRTSILTHDGQAQPHARPSDRAELGAWLLSRHDKLELLAPTATFSYPFDEVYIPLEIAMQEAWQGQRDGRSLDGDLEPGMGRDIVLPEIFARARQDREVMIFGNPGAGKTTTLEKICHQMLIEGGEAVGLPRETLPILLPLRHATREDLAQPDPLLQLARRETARGDNPLSVGVLDRLWAQGGLLLMLDGLDEIADLELRDALVQLVVGNAPARRRQGIRHVVSSRFSGVTLAIREVLDASFLRLDVRPLQRDRIEALVHSWFRAAKHWQAAPRTADERARVEADAREHAGRVLAELRRIEHEDFEFKNLVATPLLLTLLCAVALANGQIPHKRPEFYQRCLEVLLRRYTHKTGQPAPVPEPEALRVLQEVAHGLHETRRRDGLDTQGFASWASRRGDRGNRTPLGPAKATELLEWLHQHAGVLTKFGDGDYGFAHLTFQEYLAALHIAYGGDEPVEALADRFGDPWWQEVTLLCLALPPRRTFEVFMNRVLEGERWLSDAVGDDAGAPEVQRESKLPLQLLRECWEDSEERTVKPFLRVLRRPRGAGGWLAWVRGVFGRPVDVERIDQQRIKVMQLLLGETDTELVALAEKLGADTRESDAVRALANELVVRAKRQAVMHEAAGVQHEVWDDRDTGALAPEPSPVEEEEDDDIEELQADPSAVVEQARGDEELESNDEDDFTGENEDEDDFDGDDAVSPGAVSVDADYEHAKEAPARYPRLGEPQNEITTGEAMADRSLGESPRGFVGGHAAAERRPDDAAQGFAADEAPEDQSLDDALAELGDEGGPARATLTEESKSAAAPGGAGRAALRAKRVASGGAFGSEDGWLGWIRREASRDEPAPPPKPAQEPEAVTARPHDEPEPVATQPPEPAPEPAFETATPPVLTRALASAGAGVAKAAPDSADAPLLEPALDPSDAPAASPAEALAPEPVRTTVLERALEPAAPPERERKQTKPATAASKPKPSPRSPAAAAMPPPPSAPGLATGAAPAPASAPARGPAPVVAARPTNASGPVAAPTSSRSPAPSPSPETRDSRTAIIAVGGGAAPPSEQAPDHIEEEWVEPITKIRFLWVPGGQFMMGSQEDEPDSNDAEKPAHLVTLRGFWLAETPVTNAQYREYMMAREAAAEPEYWRNRRFSSRDQPVVGVNWDEARIFCMWLRGVSGRPIDLPSEAQWERAARGEDGRRYPWGSKPPHTSRACFARNALGGLQTTSVGMYPAGRGPYGHLDLAGNVWELCRDAWDPSAYARPYVWAQVDPYVQNLSTLRASRGGSWKSSAEFLRAAARYEFPSTGRGDSLGFRVCSVRR
jgi:formylglycine-generating enzyme required for sulfatase activity